MRRIVFYQSVCEPPFIGTPEVVPVSLTPNQLTTLKADILADPVLAALTGTPDGRADIATAYAATASPDFWVWKTYLTKSDIYNTTSPDSTTWTWVGNGFLSRTQSEQATWNELFGPAGAVDPSLVQVRNAAAAILTGAGNAAANIAHLLAMAREKANRLEKLLATGAGSTGSPATRGYKGVISGGDVQSALNLP